MNSSCRTERSQSDRFRIKDHPFKRRRQRAAACSILLFGLSSVSAFVTFPLKVPFQKLHYQRDRRLLLQNNADISGDEATGEAADGKSYRIPSEQLERIKESVDIVSVVESYGLQGFQRQGDHRAKAICPFHNDHNPSLSIDNQRGMYKCFSCGAGGDVFHFVREYSALKSEPMTFYQAVRHVAQELGDPNLQLDFVFSSGESRISHEERKTLNEKKQRLLLANAAAAAFYGMCLISVPAAGVARSHLQARGLSPTTVQAFAMGYAPDAYFRVKGEWGKGGLVHHLRDLGFKPTEIMEAGLATRTKGFQRKAAVEGNDIATNSVNNVTISQAEEKDDDYDTLIDRFRNRLVVPIFDGKGANVLGFGGRILPPEEDNDSSYKNPKYINSPESLVFHKKDVIFGQHSASKAVPSMRKTDGNGQTGPERASVVIVEGYMDAIALWEAGVREVVASMGTALTMEQLASAARTAGTRGGRIVLCFDSDEAGVYAIERLCTGSLLIKTAETFVVEILVATLPSGVKDPAEYVELGDKKGRSRIGEQFRKEVIDTAKDWTVWYLDRLLSCYDEIALHGIAGSFADICDRVSEFLSRFPNPAERTKRAHDVAGSLADVISCGSDSGQVSNALRIQLESDLVNMVARKADARESIERRIESVEGSSADVINQKLWKMTKGDGMSPSDDSSKLSTRALKALKKGDLLLPSSGKANDTRIIRSRRSSHTGSGSVGSRQGVRRRMRRSSTAKLSQLPLTPHFCGFHFENQSDADWLNLPREKWKRRHTHLTLGTKMDGEQIAKAVASRMGKDFLSGVVVNDLVYFNSNQYHGNQFLTEDAINAGYRNGEVARDASIFEHGIGTLVIQDADVLVKAAEDKLLRNLVKFDRARTAMIHSLASNDATGSPSRIEWSMPERAWLFHCLVVHPETVPKDLLVDGRMYDLRNYLANLPDSPPCAFSLAAPSASAGTVISGLEKETTTLESSADDGTTDVVFPMENAETAKKVTASLSNGFSEMVDVVYDVNIPSHSGDIESWASTYDPSMFDDVDPVSQVQDSAEGDPTLVIADPFPHDEDTRVSGVEISPGSLDLFFAVEEDLFAGTYDDSVSRELRAELEVQEAHATLQRASALKQLKALNAEWLAVGRVLMARLDEQDSAETDLSPSTDKDASQPNGIIQLDTMHIDDLKEHWNFLAARLRDISERAHHLDVSAKRIVSRLMDYSNADGIEGRLSVAQQEELASMVDDHLESLPQTWRAPDSGEGNRFHNNRDPASGWGDEYGLDRNESFDEDMARISDDWGEWADDDFTWSPEGNLDSFMLTRRSNDDSHNVMESRFDNFELESQILEDEESLEDALHRINAEWGDWVHDPPLPAVHVLESNNEFALPEDKNEEKTVKNESVIDDDFFGPSTDESVDLFGPDFRSVFE